MAGNLNYYQILRIRPDADPAQVREALEKMRKMDRDGSYSATINSMEAILTDIEKRQAYNREHGLSTISQPVGRAHNIDGYGYEEMDVDYEDMFVDVHEPHTHDSVTRKKQALENGSRDLAAELGVGSSFSRNNQRRINSQISLNFKSLLSLIVVGVLIFAGFIFSKPMMEMMKGHQQVEAAMKALDSAQDTVKAKTLHDQGVFPEKMTIDAQGQPYTIVVNGISSPKTITLTFDNQAIEALRNQRIVRSFIEDRPNITFWQCAPAPGFPADYMPQTCL